MPPLSKTERPPSFATVTLDDVDRGVRHWFDKVVDVHVPDQDGQRQKVKVIWSAGERWVTGKDVRGVRDKDGRLILPLIAVRRTAVDPINGMSALGSNVPRLQISRQVAPKTNLNREQIANRPISARRLRDSAVYEVTTIPFPFVGMARYELVVQTQYMWQMNQIVEKILSQLEFYDVPCFVIMLREAKDVAIKDGIGPSEVKPSDDSEYSDRAPLSSYYVVGYFEGDIADSGNLEEFTDQERIVKMTMTFKVPVYLQLDPEGKRPAAQKELTAAQIRISDESVCFVDDPAELDVIFGPSGASVYEAPGKTRRR